MRTLLAACLLLAPAAAQAQHITAESITNILADAEKISEPTTARIPAGLPLAAAQFAGKPWWAVLQMCSEHRSGAGRAPGTPAPVLDALGEKNRVFFMLRASLQFSRDFKMTPVDAQLPVGGWGSEFGAAMTRAATAGAWSSSEFEDACRILGPAHLRAGK